jgi:hypothetical protein
VSHMGPSSPWWRASAFRHRAGPPAGATLDGLTEMRAVTDYTPRCPACAGPHTYVTYLTVATRFLICTDCAHAFEAPRPQHVQPAPERADRRFR